MSAIRMSSTTDRFKIPETVPRRRSTRTRRSPREWWKEGLNLTASELPNAVQIELSSLSDAQQPAQRRGRRISKIEQHRKPRSRPRSQETVQSCRKGIEQDKEVRFSHEATDDEVSTVVFDSAATYESEGNLQSDAPNASEPPFSNKIATTIGSVPPSHFPKADDTRAFNPNAYHPHFNSATCTTQQAGKESKETGNYKHPEITARIKENTNNQDDEEMKNRTCFQVLSGMQAERSCETWLSANRIDGTRCSLLPGSPDTTAYEKRSVYEVKRQPTGTQLVSEDHSEGKSTPLSADVSQHLPCHILADGAETRLSERLVEGEALNEEHRRSSGRHSKPLSKDIKYTSRKDVRKRTYPLLQSSRTLNPIYGMALHPSGEPSSLDDSEECFGVEETVPSFSRRFRVPESCSACSSQVCVCELNLIAQERETATAHVAMGFKVRRGSKIHYATERGFFGLIKFGIRSCSDGILVGELTVCPQSATGPRRTCGHKELYIVLRGFIILEVHDSVIHLREGDEVEFEGNTVFQLRNRCLRSADLLCVLLSTE